VACSKHASNTDVAMPLVGLSARFQREAPPDKARQHCLSPQVTFFLLVASACGPDRIWRRGAAWPRMAGEQPLVSHGVHAAADGILGSFEGLPGSGGLAGVCLWWHGAWWSLAAAASGHNGGVGAGQKAAGWTSTIQSVKCRRWWWCGKHRLPVAENGSPLGGSVANWLLMSAFSG
jgi:hypothetical protein